MQRITPATVGFSQQTFTASGCPDTLVPFLFARSEVMPMFCYTNEKGETIERLFHCGEAPHTLAVDGDVYDRDIAAEWGGRRATPGNWPRKSDALGVHHSQIGEAAEHLASCGVPTTFCNDGTGRCNVESQGHQNRIMEAMGMHDRDACYSQRAKP